MRILIVEDYPGFAESLVGLLGSWGHEVRSALNGSAALQAAQEDPPDVVIFDIGFPTIPGWLVAKRLAEQGEKKKPFLIAITGYGRQEDRLRSAEVGIHLHLARPADPEELRELLVRLHGLMAT